MYNIKYIYGSIIFIIVLLNNNSCGQNKINHSGLCSEINIDTLLINLENNPKLLFDVPDECAILIIDTLTYSFIDSKDIKFVECLEKICQISDGYISDQLISEFEKFKDGSLYQLIKYFFMNKSENMCLLNYFKQYLSQLIEDSPNSENKYKEIKQYYLKQLYQSGASESILEYFSNILNEIQ